MHRRGAPGEGRASRKDLPPVQVALRFAYDGSRFEAYARNPGKATVEGALIEALRHVGLVEGSFRSGSRTDRGVSALENVCRVALERPHLRGLVPSLQKHVPAGLWLTGAAPVVADWNPRHGARRRYRYMLPQNGERLGPMRAAARAFLGRHDMRGFARLEPGRDPVRRIDRFSIAPLPGGWLMRIESPGFLWNQVRRMVDAVARVGRGGLEVDAIQAALLSGNPPNGSKLAPTEGLLLEAVRYPDLRYVREAGGLPATRLAKEWQQAEIRRALAIHLRPL